MEKTIVIKNGDENIEIPVKASMAALSLYRAEFNGDLIKDLNRVYKNIHPDPFTAAMKKAEIRGDMSQDEIAKAILEHIDYSTLEEESPLPSADDQITALHIVWTMAKAADKNIKKFDDWCDRFEILPVSGLIDKCNEIWTAANMTTVELKN